ncbi:chromosome segregation protein ScpB [Hyphomicrobium nitrativorans NL23]|uniref:Chromosome segregation protein ScpB n=1 Tax=Hyphomicrobium nitrativorans NL23 TaxID=1029756 RepID=V5SEV1_9HYPH|nr:SMC-Scp complex subunit ScpB [Hyphomicrobium nitrativorans]AHB48580.1 chromosome segregation protein ScpB [Hyphomicrobium nitrativorans NL23]
MAPPRLRLVTSEGTLNAPEAQEAIELARALGEELEGDESGSSSASVEGEVHIEDVRIVEALLFASPVPLDDTWLAGHLRHGSGIANVLAEIKAAYAPRGVNLVRVAGKWVLRTAEDLGYLLERYAVEERRLSRAALETLSIVAYHQPVTRAEIEEIRGVTTSAGTLDILMEAGWIRPRGRRRAPGKPLTYGTTDSFLAHFGLDSVKDLPGLSDLKAQGLLDGHLPPGFAIPDPTSVAALMPDELPLEEAGEDEGSAEDEASDAEADGYGDDDAVPGDGDEASDVEAGEDPDLPGDDPDAKPD